MGSMSGSDLKQSLFGRYHTQEDYNSKRQQSLDEIYNRAANKALDLKDIQEDPMQINAQKTNTTNGVGSLGAIGIAAAASLGPLALAAWLMFHPTATPNNPFPTMPVQTSPIHQPIPTAPQPTVPINIQKDGYWAQVKEEQQPDGTWKQVGVTHFRSKGGVVEQLMPDGTWQGVPK